MPSQLRIGPTSNRCSEFCGCVTIRRRRFPVVDVAIHASLTSASTTPRNCSTCTVRAPSTYSRTRIRRSVARLSLVTQVRATSSGRRYLARTAESTPDYRPFTVCLLLLRQKQLNSQHCALKEKCLSSSP